MGCLGGDGWRESSGTGRACTSTRTPLSFEVSGGQKSGPASRVERPTRGRSNCPCGNEPRLSVYNDGGHRGVHVGTREASGQRPELMHHAQSNPAVVLAFGARGRPAPAHGRGDPTAGNSLPGTPLSARPGCPATTMRPSSGTQGSSSDIRQAYAEEGARR